MQVPHEGSVGASFWLAVQLDATGKACMHDLVSRGTICVHCMQVASIGWSSVFYIFGSLGVLWFAFWVQNASSSPVGDSLVSETEAEYIIENTCDQVCHYRHV